MLVLFAKPSFRFLSSALSFPLAALYFSDGRQF
jgi:hypothetical protein